MGLFSSAADNAFLGVDIGDSSLKMVELVKKNHKIFLSNYGFSESLVKDKLTMIDDVNYLAKLISKVRKEAGITATKVTASLPSFAVFSAVINLTNVNRKNIAEHVNDEAKKVIPLPLSEMVLDWKIVASSNGDASNTKVFLTGSPKKLIKKYINIFKSTGLELVSLETETFSLIRALLGNDKSTVMLVDFGANSTDICVIKESIPYLNRSINISGSSITETISQKLGLDTNRAEQLKSDLGLAALDNHGSQVPQTILDAIKPVANEVKYMLDLFQNSNNEKIEKIILAGGSSLLMNFASYLEEQLNLQVVIGNPWFRVISPSELKPVLTEVGPRLAVAIGLALRGIN